MCNESFTSMVIVQCRTQRGKEITSKVVTKKRVTENDHIFGAQMSKQLGI